MWKLAILLALAALQPGSPPPASPPPDPWEGVGFTAIELGPLFRGAQAGVLGLDGAFSLPMTGGKSLWVFGDTLLGSWRPGGKRTIDAMPPNTAAIAADADWVTGFGHATFLGTPRPAPALRIGDLAAGERVWPLDLVRIAGRAWLYYVVIAPAGTGPLDFKVVGTGVAPWADKTPAGFAGRGRLWSGDAPSFGASALAWEGQLYVFAGGISTYVARLPLGRPDQPAAYRYWAGSRGWVGDWHQAEALPGSGPEVSVRYNAWLKSFLMVYVAPFGHHVEARLAPRPEGPWSAPRLVAPCLPLDAMVYGAKQHSELESEGGRQVFLTYNTNGSAEQLTDRPDLYWPHGLRLTFAPRPEHTAGR